MKMQQDIKSAKSRRSVFQDGEGFDLKNDANDNIAYVIRNESVNISGSIRENSLLLL
jgi:hypothetical protein